MLEFNFSDAAAIAQWTYYPATWKLDEPADAETREVVRSDGGELSIEPGTRWSSPAFACEPGVYYRLRVHARAATSRECWGALYFDSADRALAADTYDGVDASEDGAEQVFVFRPTEGAVTARVTFFSVQSPLRIRAVAVERIPDEVARAWADALYAGLPPARAVPAAQGLDRLPRTLRAFREGGDLRVVMLGDSIINDTQNSLFEMLLHRRFPGLHLSILASVRGSTHCWYYQEPEHYASYVADLKPDLLIIGGGSHREQIEPIRGVIRRAVTETGCEVILMSGPMGPDVRTVPEDAETGAPLPATDSAPRPFDLLLGDLAREEGVAFMDMGTAWQAYLAASGTPHGWLNRDRVHANYRGKQILARLVERSFANGLDGHR